MLTPTTAGRPGSSRLERAGPSPPGAPCHPRAETRPLAWGWGAGAVKAALDLSSPRVVVGRARWPPSTPSESCLSLLPAGFRDFYTKVLEEEAASVSSADTGRAVASAWGWGWGRATWSCLHLPCHPPSLSPGLCSEACLSRLARCPAPKLLRARSAEKRRPVPTFQKVPLPSGPAPAHSLGDLKGSWPGRGLVTRFLQMSKKAPDPSGSGAPGHKQVGIRGAGKIRRTAWSFRLDRRCPPLCAAGGPEPVGPAGPGEPPPSKLRRSELRRLPAAPPVWPPAGARCPTPQPQPQWGQPGDRALTWASGPTEQIRTDAGATGSIQRVGTSSPQHSLALAGTERNPPNTPKSISSPPTSGGPCCLPLLLWPGGASVLWCMVFRLWGRCRCSPHWRRK